MEELETESESVVDGTNETDGVDTEYSTCPLLSFTINKQIREKTFTGCVDQTNHIEWYLNGVRHREDGPAYEDAGGNKYWYKNNKLHREDGPAVINAEETVKWSNNGAEEWYLNGVKLTEEEFNAR